MASFSKRDLVSFYKALSIMVSSGVPLYSCFGFLSEQGESPAIQEAAGRVGKRIAEGAPLHRAMALDPTVFDYKAVRLVEAGYQSGALEVVLRRLAEDEEDAWKLTSQLKSDLVYPLGIAGIAVIGVLLLPPLVLNKLLAQIVELTAKPPAITLFLIRFSSWVASPAALGSLATLCAALFWFSRTDRWSRLKDRLETQLWSLPALGPLWQNLVAVRFLSVFSLTYECGLPVTQCLSLAASATGSLRTHLAGKRMRDELVAGGTLREAFEAGRFLPALALEAVEAGQQSGTVSGILEDSARILKAELKSRMEAVSKLVEPLVLTFLGVFVGVFALGCLLPLIRLVETL